ncbi:hypothetical protein AGR2A_Cc150002 [Agrobacterium genomosp. 2 str. CFBP 5494]|uniref:Uncharacterized protein n=2 Tax=Agrobacterium TaxID=357 RepID=U4PYI1_9HYPH|nr:protein of unknown function [Agrobacterium pusense]CUW88904.1 hypothetical protein AGR2A_Cc150002 [Agrobacterium genomosp. 2 str. CFBP 5494]
MCEFAVTGEIELSCLCGSYRTDLPTVSALAGPTDAQKTTHELKRPPRRPERALIKN